MTKLTPQELDERIRTELLDLLKRLVPEGGLKYENIELLKKHVDLTIDNLKPTYRDCIEAVTPTEAQIEGGGTLYTPDYYLAAEIAIETIQANTKELLG